MSSEMNNMAHASAAGHMFRSTYRDDTSSIPSPAKTIYRLCLVTWAYDQLI